MKSIDFSNAGSPLSRGRQSSASQEQRIDVALWRKDFPIFETKNRNKPVIYLDSASSAQKPKQVIDAISHFYANGYANIHRGIYELSEKASQLFEDSRSRVKEFIGLDQQYDAIFVRGTTEGINLVANSFARSQFKAGDEIILSGMEHHSNIVPWLLLKEQLGVRLKMIPVEDHGTLDLDAYQKLFSSRTKLVSFCHASNVLGTLNPVKQMTAIAHEQGVPVLIDGAQAVPHTGVDVRDLDCDFYVFSAHKLYGPSGIGVLCGKKKYLDSMPVYQGGGGMIETVSFDQVTFAKSPHKFEAGTPDIAGVVGLKAAIDYFLSRSPEMIFAHEQDLLQYAESKLQTIDGLRMIGTAKPKVGVISFVLNDIHAHDLGTVLDHEGIAIRAGHHCAMPLMQRFNVPATVRVSFGLYNTQHDVDELVNAIQLAERMFR